MEKEKELSAVEFLHSEYKKILGDVGVNFEQIFKLTDAFEQAKEVEKEQHQETWNVAHQAGRFEGKGIAEENWFTFEEYWEETFKQQEQ
jgi:hypothetical protein